MLVLTACAADSALDELDRARIELDGRTMTVLVADTPGARSQGLRDVERLPDGIDGMLFVFEEARSVTFGMRDTLVPLDVWWFDEAGVLLGAAAMEPCPSEPCPTYGSPGGVKWAVETPVGEVELAPGDRLIVVTSS